MVDGSTVLMATKSMNKRFIRKWGYTYQALITKRKEPLTRSTSMIAAFLGLPTGTKLGSITVHPNSKAYISLRCLNTPAALKGLAEFVRSLKGVSA